VQLFSGGIDPRRHCLSAVEGMDRAGHATVLIGSSESVREHTERFAYGGLEVAASGWDIRAPGIAWTGSWPESELRCEWEGLHARARVENVLWWIKLPRVLTYWSGFGGIDWCGTHGTGLVEHAWGADSPLDIARIPPRKWHWDVLRFADGSACAGLSLDLVAGLWGVRGGGRVAGEAWSDRAFANIEVIEKRSDTAANRAAPNRWRGTLRIAGGVLRYEARASTPVAAMVPDGGFLGFDFEGEWKGRVLNGTGFCEYRDG
jgi:hypothetical protein